MSYISAKSVNDDVLVWERTKEGREKLIYTAPYYFYVEDPEGKHETIYGDRVSKIKCQTRDDFNKAKDQCLQDDLRVFETDISTVHRVLSKHYYGKPAPKLHISFYDIEVDYDPDLGFPSSKNCYAPVNSVSIVHNWSKRLVVLTVPPEDGWTNERLTREVIDAVPDVPVPSEYKLDIQICENERELLLKFLQEIEDSDVLCGWNSDMFDTPYLALRIAQVLDKQSLSVETTERRNEFTGATAFDFTENPNSTIKRSCKFLRRLDFEECSPTFRVALNRERSKVYGVMLDTQGRIMADYLDLYRKYEVSEKSSYKLASIEQEVGLNLPKLEYNGTLHGLYRNNYPFFVRYNIRDTEILDGFEKKLGYVELANQMYHISATTFEAVLGTLKLAEFAVVNYCHHTLKKVVPDSKTPTVDRQIAGALVLLPQVNLHEWIGSIDINSLYPNTIRSINISPETVRGQFETDIKACEAIAADSFESLTLVLESGKKITKTGQEWKLWLKEKKWAISGYGTVFDQTAPGIIPSIQKEWYTTRKKYQAMMKDADKAGDSETAGYYDRLQYVYKIKLNSFYGALTNLYFRFFDLRLGESTTGTGRMILRHQCRKVAEVLDGNYNVDFPLYETEKEANEHDWPSTVALENPKFNGKFMSESVLYGDTDSTYFLTHMSNRESAVMIADSVAKAVNDSYQQFMRDQFLCNPGFDDIIKCGREIVSDRGILVDKKRYILHVVDKEGKLVDTMKVMGLDTKKTTLPKHVSDKLNGFIEDYLKGATWEKVANDIVDYKDVLQSSKDVMLIGLPKGVQNVEEYTSTYQQYGVAARLPGHVAASIHYNECLKKFGDKISIPIISGMKIKVFYLEGKVHEKFKSIALPTDIEVVPEWFLSNFKIDYEAHIERLVDNPLENILKAIGKTSPTRQDIFFEELFSY